MVEEITTYQFSRRFKKEYNNLPKEIQKAFYAGLELLRKSSVFKEFFRHFTDHRSKFPGRCRLDIINDLNDYSVITVQSFLNLGFYLVSSVFRKIFVHSKVNDYLA